MQDDMIQRFHLALPEIRRWIDEYLNDHADDTRPVNALGFSRLAEYFPQGILESTNVVTVTQVPFPPVDSMGLPEFADMQQREFGGITFKDTFFVRPDQVSESLCFHELVHIVQWARLGIDKFLLAYALGIVQLGYEQSPLEEMAYTLQHSFDEGQPLRELTHDIETRTDEIWAQVAPLVQAGGSDVGA